MYKPVFTVMLILLSGCATSSIKGGEFVGITYEQAVTSNGKPTKEFNFIFNKKDSLLEYQSNLYAVLKNEDNVKLTEAWWESDNETLIIWFRTQKNGLIAIDSLRYGKNVSF